MSDDIVGNLKQPAHWIRIAFMIAMAVALYLAGMILTLLIIAQAVFALLTGAANRNLGELGASLTHYVRQVLDFLTYNSDFKPFPFAPLPGIEEAPGPEAPYAEEGYDQDVEVHIPEGAGHEPTEEPQPVVKSSRKRSAAAKAPAKRTVSDGE